MKNPLGFGVAILATATLAFAGGDDEKKGKGDKKSPKKTEPTAQSWSGAAGKGLTYSSDMFSLNLRTGVQVALDFAANDLAPDTMNFNVRRARTHLSGHIWNKDVTYHLSNEWTADGTPSSLKELSVDWMFHRTQSYDLGVEVGQMKTRFGNEWASRYDELEFVDRGLATRTFTGARSRGAMLHGDMTSQNLGWSLTGHNTDNAAAAINSGEEGDPRGGAPDNSDNKVNWNIEAHWSNSPTAPKMGGAQGDLPAAGGVGMLFGVAYNIGSAVAGGADVDVNSLNVFGRVDTGSGLSFNAEYFMREEDPTGGTASDSAGYQVSGSWVAPAAGGGNRFGAGLRYAFVELDSNNPTTLLAAGLPPGAESTEIEFAINMFHHDHAMKSQLGVTLQEIAVPGASVDNILVSLQTTVVF
jgi:hypothetical protein